MRDPYEILGVSKGASEAEIKSAYRQARQEAASRRQQARPQGGLALRRAQRRLRDRRRRRQAQGLRPRRDRRRGQAALPRLRRFRRAARRRPPRAGRAVRKLQLRPRWLPARRPRRRFRRRRRLRGYAARHVRRRGARRRQRRLRRPVRAGRFRRSRRPARTCMPRSPSRCRKPPRAAKTRVHLPTGKDIEVKIPAGLTSGQTIRLKGQGWPSAAGNAGDALITVNVAPHPLFKPDGARPAARSAGHALRSGARRQSARADARRRGRAGDSRRHQFRPHLPPQGQGPQSQRAAPATCSPPCASCCRRAPTTSSRS